MKIFVTMESGGEDHGQFWFRDYFGVHMQKEQSQESKRIESNAYIDVKNDKGESCSVTWNQWTLYSKGEFIRNRNRNSRFHGV
ncbi:hypothetical protein ACJROX_15760 [Pseudalkalibacillus sp. A8]|uniref:hypothetical protein n=1 Tax=Pseudalkalibacillus sp. A8 TaxID=3382641 RepID=UPI0038B664EA